MQGVRGLGVVCLAAGILAIGSTSAAAQDSRGAITGVVRDTSKAIVPGATVSATNSEMGTTATAVTNETGAFQIPYLLAGTYRLTVELQGFKKYVRDKIEVRIADRLE